LKKVWKNVYFPDIDMKWLTIGFVVIIILIIAVADLGLGNIFFSFIYRIPMADKIGHFVLMGILSFLVNYFLKVRKITILTRKMLLGSLLVLVVVTIEELSQILLQYRSFSIMDLLCDYGGILLAGRLAVFFIKRRNNQEISETG
jgi:hypothetical protein